MSIEIVERLAPHLAWPVVALIALPFVVWKFNSFAKAIGEARKLSESIPELVQVAETIRQSAAGIQGVRKDIEQIRQAQVAERAERLAEEEVTDAGQEIALEDPAHPIPEPAANPDDADLRYQRLSDLWRAVLVALNGAYGRGRLGVPDRRSVGDASLKLADGRRRNPLSLKDVELLATLHGKYKSFTRVRASNPDRLTAEALDEFEARSREAIARLESFGT